MLVVIIALTPIQTVQVGAEEGDKEVEQEKTYVGEDYEVNFKVTKQWEDSFNADITITNTT